MKARAHVATPEMEGLYQEALAAVRPVIDAHPEIKTLHVIAIFSRLVGYSIAACFPDERDLARKTAIENMDGATADVAQEVPERKGVRQ